MNKKPDQLTPTDAKTFRTLYSNYMSMSAFPHEVKLVFSVVVPEKRQIRQEVEIWMTKENAQSLLKMMEGQLNPRIQVPTMMPPPQAH